MGTVTSLEERRNRDKPHFVVMALCCSCLYRWIGTVVAQVSLFKLECPVCGDQNSFGSIVTKEYAEALSEE